MSSWFSPTVTSLPEQRPLSPSPASPLGRWGLAFCLAGVGFLVAVQFQAGFGANGLVARSWLDALHVPWAFLLTLGCWVLFYRLPSGTRLLLTGLAAAAAGIGTEYGQQFIASRSASLTDLATNLITVVLALTWLRLRPSPIALLLLFLAGLLSLSHPLRAYRIINAQQQQFPTLYAEGNLWLGALLSWNIEPCSKTDPHRCLDGRPYPGVWVREQDQSWSNYSKLVVEMSLDFHRSITITAATHLRDDNQPGPVHHVDRQLEPGRHSLIFPVPSLIDSEHPVVETLLLYGQGVDAGARVVLHGLRLER